MDVLPVRNVGHREGIGGIGVGGVGGVGVDVVEEFLLAVYDVGGELKRKMVVGVVR